MLCKCLGELVSWLLAKYEKELFGVLSMKKNSLEFFFFPALSLHCSLSRNVSSDLPSQPMTQERMAPNID